MNRTTKAQWFCTPTQFRPRPAYPSKQKKQRTQANPLARSTMKPRLTAGGVLKEKPARRQRLSIRFGAMVAELSS